MYSGKGGDVSEELWHRCLTRLEDELPSQQFNMWIRPLQVTASADGGELTLFAPNRFVVDWVRDKYLERIGEVLGELQSGPLPQLRLEVGSSRAPAAPARAPGPAPAERRPQALSEPRAKAVSPELGGAAKHRSNLNSSFTFVTFVEGKSNRMACAAAQQVAENPASHGYNPCCCTGAWAWARPISCMPWATSCSGAIPTPRWCTCTASASWRT